MNKYDKILNLCVSKEHEYREWMKKPFIIGDNAFSTNGHILVSVPLSKCEGSYDKLSALEPDKILSTIPKKEELPLILLYPELIDSIVEKCPTQKETIKVGEDVECDACDGHGTVEYEFQYDGKKKKEKFWHNHYTEELDCPICKGSGNMEEAQEVETENTILKNGAIIRVKKSCFYMDVFKNLFEISKLNDNSDVFLYSQVAEMSPNLFECGDVQIVVMPMHFDLQNEKAFFTLT